MDLPDQFLIFLHIFRIFFSKSRTHFRHGLPACCEQHLLCTKGTGLIHVSPVNVYPVIFTTYKKSVFIQLSLTELHKRAHFRVNLADKFQVAIRLIMIKHAQDPEQGIVHDGIDMSCHRIISTKCQKSSLVNIRICQQILIYKKALVGVSGPDPFVTFHAIQEKDTAAKTEGMLCHLPDLIQFLVTAFKRSAFREIHILVEGCDFYIFSFAVRNKCKTDCTARTSVCYRIRLPAIIAMLKVKSFVHGLTAKNFHLRTILTFILYINRRRQFRLKLCQHATVYLADFHRLALFFCIFPHSRILSRLGKILTHSNRH